MKSHLRGVEADAARAQARVQDCASRVEFLNQQIEEARRRGVDGFDGERFMIAKRG